MFIFQFMNKNKLNAILINIKIYIIKHFKTNFIIDNSIICEHSIDFMINNTMCINSKLLFIKYVNNKMINYV